MAEEQEQIHSSYYAHPKPPECESASGMVQVVRQIHKRYFIAHLSLVKHAAEESAFIKNQVQILSLLTTNSF